MPPAHAITRFREIIATLEESRVQRARFDADVQSLVLRSRDIIAESRELTAKADALLAVKI